jgi:hypothetical protein
MAISQKLAALANSKFSGEDNAAFIAESNCAKSRRASLIRI